MLYIIKSTASYGGTVWAATVQMHAANSAAISSGYGVTVTLYKSGWAQAQQTFTIGDSLGSSKFGTVADVDSWLRANCGSKDLYFATVAHITEIIAAGRSMTCIEV